MASWGKRRFPILAMQVRRCLLSVSVHTKYPFQEGKIEGVRDTGFKHTHDLFIQLVSVKRSHGWNYRP